MTVASVGIGFSTFDVVVDQCNYVTGVVGLLHLKPFAYQLYDQPPHWEPLSQVSLARHQSTFWITRHLSLRLQTLSALWKAVQFKRYRKLYVQWDLLYYLSEIIFQNLVLIMQSNKKNAQP